MKFILPDGSVIETKAAKIQYQDPEKVLFLVFAWITKIKNKHCIGSFHRKIEGKKQQKQNKMYIFTTLLKLLSKSNGQKSGVSGDNSMKENILYSYNNYMRGWNRY